MESFEALHVKCSEEFERGNREQDARADAAGFDVPLDILDKERDALLAAGSLTEFISQRQQKSSIQGLNAQRVHSIRHAGRRR